MDNLLFVAALSAAATPYNASLLSKCLATARVSSVVNSMCHDGSPKYPSFLQLGDASPSEDYFVFAPIVNGTGVSPPPKHGIFGALDAARSRALLFGGCDPTDPRVGCSADVFSHRIETNAWRGLPSSVEQLAPRSGGSATPIGDAVIAYKLKQ